MRTDDNNNPAAFTIDIAYQAGLVYGSDFVNGTTFPFPSTLITAKLIGDPISQTIRVIDTVGYRTKAGYPRWTYICLPDFVWRVLTFEQKRDVVGYHYQNEGGIAMKELFPNYGQK